MGDDDAYGYGKEANVSNDRVVTRSVQIKAPASAVWSAITDPDKVGRWMNGARVESAWTVGGPITFSGNLEGMEYRNTGTILAIEPEKILRYSHLSGLAHFPDVPENYSVITLRLEPQGGDTLLSVTQECCADDATYYHARFFWTVALHVLKELVEG